MKLSAHNPKDIPAEPHYLIIVFENQSIFHEGDERSRSNPGHGYPAYTETIIVPTLIPCLTEEEVIAAATDLLRERPDRKDIKIIHVDKVADVSVSVSIDLY